VCLTLAFHIAPGTERYNNFHALWLAHRAEKAECRKTGLGRKTLSKHGIEATRKFRILIHSLDEESTKKVLSAATTAARKIAKDA
jgi:hypothetical protein